VNANSEQSPSRQRKQNEPIATSPSGDRALQCGARHTEVITFELQNVEGAPPETLPF